MDIGEEEEAKIYEPLEDPFQTDAPAEEPVTAPPAKVPEPEREKVPA